MESVGFVVGALLRRPVGARNVGARMCRRQMARGSANEIPFYDMRKLKVQYSRASGPGGQNVNKVETKAEIRLRIDDLTIPPTAMERLKDSTQSRTTREGELVVKNSETRSQKLNYEKCIRIVSDLITAALVEPKEWIKESKTAVKFHRNRLEDKKRASAKKAMRRGGDF